MPPLLPASMSHSGLYYVVCVHVESDEQNQTRGMDTWNRLTAVRGGGRRETR